MTPTVYILLCTYNGEKYLKRQIESILSQKNVSIAVMAHDDGSVDKTTGILNEYDIPLFGDEHLGAAHGFFYLLEQAPEADYYAFCDQDDVWDEDKLSCAIEKINEINAAVMQRNKAPAAYDETASQKPVLYGSGTRLVSDEGKLLTVHRADSRRSLSSRLFYSSISGNTIVMNRTMRDIAIMHHPKEMIMHDSWLVKLCIAVGGRLVIDEEPHMDYRMHSNNTVGMELNLRQKIGKFRRVVNSKGEAQELIDICSLYGLMVKPEYRALAAAAERSRTDTLTRKTLIRDYGIDFNSRGFNCAFAIKVKKGNL